MNEIIFTLYMALSDSKEHMNSAPIIQSYSEFHQCQAASYSGNKVIDKYFWFCKRKEQPKDVRK